MANSRVVGFLSPLEEKVLAARTPGPLGLNDQGDPNVISKLGDTPGPLGLNDYADPCLSSSIIPLLALSRVQVQKANGHKNKYNKVAKNGAFGSFRYRDIPGSKDAQIEVDPEWVNENIVKLQLPANLQSLPQFQFIKSLRVNKLVLQKWRAVFDLLSNDEQLLKLIQDLDPGTFYPRHIRKKVSKGISNHSWGTAIDVNSAQYPLHSHVDIEKDAKDSNLILFNRVFKPAGFSWGNKYNDPMHYEIINL